MTTETNRTLTSKKVLTPDDMRGAAVCIGMNWAEQQVRQRCFDALQKGADELERLQKQLSDEDKAHTQTIEERDRVEAYADQLAEMIGVLCEVDVGEHSSENCPWEEAIEAIKGAIADKATPSETIAVDRRTTDDKFAELKAQCQSLWRTDITLVCRLPSGHRGDHRADNNWTWNGNGCDVRDALKANDQLYRLRPLCTCQGTAHESASSSGYTPNPTCPVHAENGSEQPDEDPSGYPTAVRQP